MRDDAAVCLDAKRLYVAEAGMLALGVGSLALIVFSCWEAHRRNEDYQTVIVTAVMAILGAFVSAAEPTNGISFNRAAGQFLFFVLVAAILFGVPCILRPWRKHRWQETAAFLGVLGAAALGGTVATGLVQEGSSLLPDSWFPPGQVAAYRWDHPSFWISRPIGTGMLMAPWILATYDPLLDSSTWRRGRLWRWGWGAAYFGMAPVLVGLYAMWFYLPRHEWPSEVGIESIAVVGMFVALILPPLPGAGLLLAAEAQPRWMRCGMRLGGVVIAGGGGVLVAVALAKYTHLLAADAILFAACHSAAALAAIWAAWAARRIGRRLGWIDYQIAVKGCGRREYREPQA